jgi:hypothetical protein
MGKYTKQDRFALKFYAKLVFLNLLRGKLMSKPNLLQKLAIAGMAGCSTLALNLLSPINAEAIDLDFVIDPGNVGDSFQSKTFDFDLLNGQPLNGDSVTLDVLFDNMKHLELDFNNSDPTSEYVYNAVLKLSHDLGVIPSGDLVNDGFLSDETGASIATATFPGGGGSLTDVFYTLGFTESSVDGLIHHDIHFQFDLFNGGTITDGELELSISSPNGTITVGEWEPVPEPGTILGLLAVAGLGLGLKRKKQL